MAKDTTWHVYVEPNEYSFQYPKDWELQLRWKRKMPSDARPKIDKNLGFEILSLYKHSPTSRKKESCGFSSNTAMVSLSIQPKDSNTIEELAHKPDVEDYNTIRQYEETLKIDNRDAIRTYSLYDRREILILAYFDYKNGKYACLSGMFSNGSDSTLLTNTIKRIQESFKILK